MLPVPAVEFADLERRNIDAVEAARVDVDLIGVRARHVERMDAAGLAERMLGGAGVELVGGQIVFAAYQFELLGRHDEMQKALLGAHRAIAIRDAAEIGGDRKTHPAAVAAAFVDFLRVLSQLFPAAA